jgi:hypothetical protein
LAWGISIWGISVWGGAPTTENLSFEVPELGGAKGEANQWAVDSVSAQEMIGAFEAIGGTWDPWEDYEEQWRASFLVHVVPDTANLLTSPAATDQPSAITLANELAERYPAHLRLIDQPAKVENGTNEPWSISDGDTLTLKVNRGGEQTITLSGLTPGSATAEQVAQSLNQQLFEARATVTSGGLRVTITTIHRGRERYIEVTGGTANTAMAFPTTEQAGTDNVHLEADVDNTVVFSPNPASDYITLALVVMTLKQAFNDHIWDWPDVHRKWDKDNEVTSPDISLDPPNPAELAALIVLLNEMRLDFNNHIVLLGYDDFNEESLFAFLDSHLTPAVFDPNLGSEGFERAWAIKDLYPEALDQMDMVSVDGPGHWRLEIASIPDDGDSIIIDDERGNGPLTFEFDDNGSWNPDNIRVDIAGATTVAQVRYTLAGEISISALQLDVDEPLSDVILLTPADAARATETMVNPGTAGDHIGTYLMIASWPDGHEEFLSVLEYIDTEIGIRERFEASWFLPGSTPGAPNDRFLSRYLKTSADGDYWAFSDAQLSAGITENFEAGWKDNDEGATKYWSGSEWRFLASHLWVFGVGEYTFADYNLQTQVGNTYPALTSGDFSRRMYAKVTELIQANMPAVAITFKDALGATQNLIFWFDDPDDTGPDDEVYDVSITFATPLITDPRYRFEELFDGVTEVTFAGGYGPESGGAVDIMGWEKAHEDFSDDWTLSLD